MTVIVLHIENLWKVFHMVTFYDLLSIKFISINVEYDSIVVKPP